MTICALVQVAFGAHLPPPTPVVSAKGGLHVFHVIRPHAVFKPALPRIVAAFHSGMRFVDQDGLDARRSKLNAGSMLLHTCRLLPCMDPDTHSPFFAVAPHIIWDRSERYRMLLRRGFVFVPVCRCLFAPLHTDIQ